MGSAGSGVTFSAYTSALGQRQYGWRVAERHRILGFFRQTSYCLIRVSIPGFHPNATDACRSGIRKPQATPDLSRFCTTPLITLRAAKEMNHGPRQDG